MYNKNFSEYFAYMRLCTIILYDHSGHRCLYGPFTFHAQQRNAIITHSEYIIFTSLLKHFCSNALKYYVTISS